MDRSTSMGLRWATWAVLAACDPTDGSSALTDAAVGASTHPEDADQARSDTGGLGGDSCRETRWAGRNLQIRQCPEPGRLALAASLAGPAFAYVEVRGEGLAVPLTADRLPGLTWRTTETDATVKFEGEATLSMTITELEGESGSASVTAALSWPATSNSPAPLRPVLRVSGPPGAEAIPLLARRALLSSKVGQVLLTQGWGSTDGAFVWPTVDGDAVEFRPPDVADLLPGATHVLSAVELDPGATRADAESRWVARHATTSLPAPRWGWRSGLDPGGGVSERALLAIASALPRDLGHGSPLLLAEAGVFAAPGSDALRPGFSGGLGATVSALRAEGAALVVAWSPLAPTPGSSCPDCILDARRPEVRDALTRRARELFEAGIAGVMLSQPPTRPASQDEEALIAGWSAFFPALRSVAGPETLLMGPEPEFSSLPDAPETVDAAPVPPPGRLSPAALAAQERALALSLVDSWPLSAAGLRLSNGGLSVAGAPPAQARRLAALSALTGGLYLLSDRPEDLAPEELALFVAPLQRGLLRAPAARPRWLDGANGGPPDVWHREGHALAVFNPSDSAAVYPSVAELAPELAAARLIEVFSGARVLPGDPISVPGQDVWVVVAESGDLR